MTDTRKLFFDALTVVANDPKVIFLTGDLGYSFMESFQKEFPNQFINCGIAEQNMVGVAAGLALAGKRPFVYSGAMFLLYRAAEQMRDDVALPGLDVKFVGTNASGFLGFTHNLYPSESPRQMVTAIPGFRYAEPRDNHSMTMALKLPGPTFVRL